MCVQKQSCVCNVLTLSNFNLHKNIKCFTNIETNHILYSNFRTYLDEYLIVIQILKVYTKILYCDFFHGVKSNKQPN